MEDPKPDQTMKVWLDQDLCTGCGCCEASAPDVFKLGEDGASHVKQEGRVLPGEGYEALAVVPDDSRDQVIAAAEECPGEIISIEYEARETTA